MSEVKWIKIVTDIFDDEKILLIETLPEGDSIIVIWFKLLCLAGKQNNSGVFIMQNGLPYTDKMLAVIFRRKEATVRLAIEAFLSFGMIEIVENSITIPNWGKHQNFDKIELKNEYMRNYMKGYRTKQKLIAASTQDEDVLLDSEANSKANSKANVSLADKIRLDKIIKDNISTDLDKSVEHISPSEEPQNSITRKNNASLYTDEFEMFWSAYPAKVGKADAAKKFQKALKVISIEELIEAVKQYCKRKKVLEGFICNPATWLHQERWKDVESVAVPTDPNRPKGAVRKTASGWWVDKNGYPIMQPEF